jgi:tetratricopeptide (TPR) repeat protein
LRAESTPTSPPPPPADAAAPSKPWTRVSLGAALRGGCGYAGQLAELSHDDFVAAVERHGGRYVPYAHGARMGVLVVGGAGLPLTAAGEPVDLRGRPAIEERSFLDLLGEAAADDGLYSAAQLAQVLGVPEARLRAWVKAGLLVPRGGRHGVARFDFRQASRVRTLCDLTAAGVGVATLRRSLKQLQAWLPRGEGKQDEFADPLAKLAVLERNGPLLVRLESGALAEVDGQMHLSFEPPGDREHDPTQPLQMPQFRLTVGPQSAADWHEQAVAQERAGLLGEAEASYRKALQVGGPDPQICFDLAHLLATTNRGEAAAERYQQVVELDPRRGDAWNNLGILLADAGRAAPAADAFRQAIALDADDPLAHYNLADTLEALGFPADAADHWRAYLRLDPTTSAWAEHARARLRSG